MVRDLVKLLVSMLIPSSDRIAGKLLTSVNKRYRAACRHLFPLIKERQDSLDQNGGDYISVMIDLKPALSETPTSRMTSLRGSCKTLPATSANQVCSATEYLS